jgi:hypothetical protein
MKIIKKQCPICKKKLEATSKSQAEYNYYLHLASCKKKLKKFELLKVEELKK